jgi:hypothetical protein
VSFAADRGASASRSRRACDSAPAHSAGRASSSDPTWRPPTPASSPSHRNESCSWAPGRRSRPLRQARKPGRLHRRHPHPRVQPARSAALQDPGRRTSRRRSHPSRRPTRNLTVRHVTPSAFGRRTGADGSTTTHAVTAHPPPQNRPRSLRLCASGRRAGVVGSWWGFGAAYGTTPLCLDGKAVGTL